MKTIKYFSATWCAPCKMFKPVMQEVSQMGNSVQFIDVDADSNLAGQYSIRSVPTCVVEENGAEVARFTGAVSKEAVLSYLK